MDLKGKRVLVVGLGKSGLAAARFLSQKGAHVTVNDQKPESELKEALDELKDLNLEQVLGSHPEEIFLAADLVVTSPGVPRSLPVLKEALDKGITVISELELAFQFLSGSSPGPHACNLVAVSGTNGKTTVTTLLGEIFKKQYGPRVFVGGNIGNPLTEALIKGRQVEMIICEVSSFQLEFIESFKPRVAVMLNISDDHLDRYRDLEEYAEVKSWLFRYQDNEDYAVLNARDPLVARMAENISASLIWFGDEKRKSGVFMRGREIIFISPRGEEARIPIREISLPGEHNIENLLAAAAAALALAVPAQAIQDAAAEFKGLPHRMEYLREENGVRYYNDSKGTNVGAVQRALMTFSGPVILLMGGQAKGCRFEELKPAMQGRVKAILAYGESRDQIARELESPADYDIQVVLNLEQAVRRARERAKPGDVILLSPGCASFDQFRDYKDRGDTFRRLIQAR
jgi:UDP-N-acetylmuramoylalanine--D-glutamate ligase